MSDRSRQAPGAAARGDGEDAVRAAKLRRGGWLLAAIAAAIYLGYIGWMLLRAPLGG